MSKWIWYPGDYEIFHNIQLHSRRQQYGADYPCMWSLSNVYPRVNFRKTADFAADGWVTLHARESGYLLVDGRRFPSDVKIPVSAGRHTFLAVIIHTHGLPAIFIETNSSCSAAEVFARETGAGLYTLDMAMSGSSYFEAMYHNIDTIKEALG